MKNGLFQKIGLISLAALFCIFTSCSSKETIVTRQKDKDEKVTLRCVIPYSDSEKTEAIKKFQYEIKDKFPEYDIYFDFIKGDLKVYETKVKVLLSSDKAPDIFYCNDADFTKELYKDKYIQAIDSKLEKTKYYDLVIPSVKNSCINGNIYTVPIDEVNYGIIEINKELFSKYKVKIPQNIEELENAVEKFKNKNIIPMTIGGKDGASVYRMIESFAYTIEPEISNKIINKEDTFSGDNFRKAAEEVKKLIDMKAFGNNAENITDEEAERLFCSGKSAMICTSSSRLKVLRNKLKNKNSLMYYPVMEEQSQFYKCVSGGIKQGCGLVISSASNYTDEALSLAVEVSKYYNKFLYEENNNAEIIYIPYKIGLEPIKDSCPDVKKLMENVIINDNVNAGILEKNISSSSLNSIKESSAAFMTGYLSVDNYLREMDNAIN